MQDFLARNGGINPRAGSLPIEPADLQRQAVIGQLGQPPAAQAQATQPVATQPGQSFSAFQRGGQVKQLPGAGAEMTNKLVGTGASVAATAAGAVNPVSIGTNYLGGKLKPKEEMPTFGGEFGDLTDSYGRRFEGAGPGVAGGAVRGAGYGAFAGPIGAGVGAAIGGIVGAATKNATSAFSDFRVEDAADAISKAYQQYLGRPASEDEIQAQLVGQGWDAAGKDRWVGEKGLFSVLGSIKNSEEAKQRATRGAVVDQLGSGPEAVAGGPPAGAVREGGALSGSASGAAPGGAGGRLEGFGGVMADGRSKLEASDSPKYQIARVLQKYPSTPDGLRAALSEINALGLGTASIGGNKGDVLTFSGNVDPRFEGITSFDVIRAAGKGGEAWQWNPTGEGAPAQAQAGSATAAGGDLGAGRGYGNIPDVIDGDMLAKIRAELERITAGQPPREQLLAQLGA